MQIALCSDEIENKQIENKIMDCLAEYDCYPAIDLFIDRVSLLKAMNTNDYSIVFVLMDKAKGLETVKHILKKKNEIKIIWFSGDKDFVRSAYEYGVTYFGIYPITKEKLREGLNRCECFADDIAVCRVHLKAENLPEGQGFLN